MQAGTDIPVVPLRSSPEENRARVLELRAEERRLGGDSPELLPALYRLAEWYESVHESDLARPVYRRIVRIIEVSFGEYDLRLVQPLTHIALTWQRQDSFRAEGREALERAGRILESSPATSAAHRADAYVNLGDWHLLSGDPAQASDCYKYAWSALMAADEGSTLLAASTFGQPKRLRYSPPDPFGYLHTKNRLNREDFAVEVEFTVEANGTIADLTVVQGSGDASVDRAIQSAVREARYRPALDNGKPVGQRVRIKQVYYHGARTPSQDSARGAELAPSVD